MTKLRFGDLDGKKAAEQHYRDRAKYAKDIEFCRDVLANLSSLPGIYASIRDFPPVLQRFPLSVLQEAAQAERNRRQTNPSRP